MGTAIALSHDVFDAALMLGVCDKIVPGLLIGALHFGHLPTVFVPAGPMTSGLSNGDKAKVREQAPRAWWAARAAGGRIGCLPRRGHLHLLRHGQQQPDAAGSHGAACAGHGLHQPRRRPARTAHPRSHAYRAGHHQEPALAPIGHVVDERCIVNAMVALLATGGSTNHLIHWVAVARAAGITIDWDDFPTVGGRAAAGARLSQWQRRCEPVPGRRPGYVIGQLLQAGLMHGDVLTVRGPGLKAFAAFPPCRPGSWHGTRPPSPATCPLRPPVHRSVPPLEAAVRQPGAA
jgi:phosphogluconate dehydratase